MSATHQLRIGDPVIYVSRWGAEPTTTTITKVTKTGWIEINLFSRVKFKPSGPTYQEVNNRSYGQVYPYSEEKLTELTAYAEAKKAEEEKKVAERQRARDEREAERKRETEEIKAICQNTLPISHFLGLADGSRLYVLTIPILEKFKERKKGFEVVIVRLIDVEEPNWDSNSRVLISKVETNVTYANGQTRSFPSCSGWTADSNHAALWETIRMRYFDSW